jgi:pimeloyl-ACP methyl ester carboxylesterase
VILLHGWLGSWNYWLSTMEFLRSSYRCYALDFWGFGESDKSAKRSRFEVGDFVALVYEFMDRMGIAAAPLVGHSMGGTVSLMLALKHPERVRKAVVVGSPIHGSSLNLLLRLAGVPWIGSIVRSQPRLLFFGIKTSRRWSPPGPAVVRDGAQTSWARSSRPPEQPAPHRFARAVELAEHPGLWHLWAARRDRQSQSGAGAEQQGAPIAHCLAGWLGPFPDAG